MKHLKLIFICTCLFITVSAQAQDADNLIKQGDKLLKEQRYRKALPFYEQAVQAEPNNAEALLNAGICYLNRYSREKALEYILKAYRIDSKVSNHVEYWVGRAYHQNYKFDSAITFFKQYSEGLGKFDQRQYDINRYIEQCEIAKNYMRNPKNYLVSNLGPNVNSSYSEHSPVIASDNSHLYFTSRRENSTEKEEFDGEPFEDIFMTERSSDSVWSKPESIHLNTSGHDASVQIFGNNDKLLIYKFTRGGDIYITEKSGDKWGDPRSFSNINTRDFEASAFLSADGNTIFFATNHYKKNGDLDIYYVEKDANGNWGKHQELKGGLINTPEDEDAPFLSADGKTLYFSSRGLKGMGGYDVYRSTKDANGKWSEPENLGYPINTPGDDVYYYISNNNKRGYIASYREGGFGEKDIYVIRPIPSVILAGAVTEDKTGDPVSDVNIIITSLKTTTTPTNSTTAVKDGKYSAPIMSYNRYKAAIVKGSDTLTTEEFEVPIFDEEGGTFTKNFVVPFTGNPEDTIRIATKDTTPVKPVVIDLNKTVYFTTASAELSASTKKQLNYVKNLMAMHSHFTIEIAGHADGAGPDDKNMTLSQNRAQAVYDYLVSKGAPKDRIKITYYGETVPVGDNNTAEGRGKNRRVEIRDIKQNKQ